MLPVLRLTADGQIHSLKECVERLGFDFKLTEEEKQERIPSGRQQS
jgi:restriction system protein